MNILAVFKRELRSYFVSPVAYVVGAIFAVIAGYFFASIVSYYSLISVQSAMNPMAAQGLNLTEGLFRPLFRNLTVVLLLLVPALTMRLLAEEKKTGTFELLITYPIRDVELVLGKFLAALALFLMMIALTGLFPLLLRLATPVPWGPLVAEYTGLVLLGMAFLSLGLFASSLTENQIIAAVGAFGALLMLWVLGWMQDSAGPTVGPLLAHLSIINHYDSFSKGVIESKDVVYYLDFTILCLFLTLRSLDSKRWRG